MERTEYLVTETLEYFLFRHAADAIHHAFVEKGQNVEIVRNRTNGHYIVIDAPEYDFMHHRLSYSVDVHSVMPLQGQVILEWPRGNNEKPEYDRAIFNANRSFGDALEEIASHISRRIDEE